MRPGINTFKSFILTKRQNRIVSREILTYRWSIKALQIRKKYHETKNGKTYLKLPIQSKTKLDKLKLLESRPFSEYHNKLINSLYSQESVSMRILKNSAEEQKHEINIDNMSYKLKAYKSALKLKNPKNVLYKIVSYYEDDKQKVRILSEEFVNNTNYNEINNKVRELNKNLSKYNIYHHTSVKDKNDNVIMLYVRIPDTLGFAV